jgi:hypothetical protein
MLDSLLDAKIAEATAPLRKELAELRAIVQSRPAAESADDLLTIEQAAKIRGCSVAALRKACQRGRIASVPYGKRGVRVKRGAL